MKTKLEKLLTQLLGAMWMVTFSIASITALVAIVKLLLSLLEVI